MGLNFICALSPGANSPWKRLTWMGQVVLEPHLQLLEDKFKDTGQKPMWPCAGAVCQMPAFPTPSFSSSVALH